MTTFLKDVITMKIRIAVTCRGPVGVEGGEELVELTLVHRGPREGTAFRFLNGWWSPGCLPRIHCTPYISFV